MRIGVAVPTVCHERSAPDERCMPHRGRLGVALSAPVPGRGVHQRALKARERCGGDRGCSHASRKGKSDEQDAHAIAEVVLREGERLPRCDQSDDQDAVRLLYDRRDRCVRARTEAINRLRATALRLALRNLPSDLTTGPALDRYDDALQSLSLLSHTTRALVEEATDTIKDVRRLNSTIAKIGASTDPFC